MTRVTVLGAGLVGSLIVRTLADDGRFEVLVCDRSEDALGSFALSAAMRFSGSSSARPGAKRSL
jgi:saccharopine dehydrogenase-like NADP-dependent oxidoreductase